VPPGKSSKGRQGLSDSQGTSSSLSTITDTGGRWKKLRKRI